MKLTVNERIKLRRKELDIEPDKIAAALGVSRATYYRYESADIEKIPIANLVPLAKILHTTPSYLMGWDDNISIENKNAINLCQSQSPFFSYFDIPVGISAGCLSAVDGINNLPKMPIADSWLVKYARDKNIVIMHVNGESMNNVIKNGATIAVLTHVSVGNIHNGDIIVAIYDDDKECTIKRFYNDPEHERYILRPDSNNPTFLDIPIPYENADRLQMFGKVVVYNVVI